METTRILCTTLPGRRSTVFLHPYNGWTITPLPEAGGYDREFIAERTISGNRESKKVLVSFEKCVNIEKIEGLRSSVTGPYGRVQEE